MVFKRIMKRLFTLSLLGLAAYQALAQYNFDFFTLTGGAGISTGGVYMANVTVGEPFTGTVTGGPYRLDAGFWSIVTATQTSGDPALTVVLTSATTVLVCWPSASIDFILEQNPDLGTSNWSPVTQQPTDDGNVKCVSLSPTGGGVFLRLKK